MALSNAKEQTNASSCKSSPVVCRLDLIQLPSDKTSTEMNWFVQFKVNKDSCGPEKCFKVLSIDCCWPVQQYSYFATAVVAHAVKHLGLDESPSKEVQLN